ncbi:intracellular exo-alpha-L-arabinofuranosidase 2 [mine drainage metagenome]|uniref:non-reducing end alpha-L-arabinofuranosidase n=1 Tax=mine drainage metagenome TaxID=410659 RepID=A0A1J5TQC8_9ZZZZ
MKKTLLSLSAFLLVLMSYSQSSIKLIVNESDPKIIINKNIYGHFAEHLGHCIYGGFYVGDSSKIKNTNGVRNDIVDALKKLKIPILRWPGGCFADTYHWKDGIGEKSKRPSIVNTNWGYVTEDNSFGTHDFLNMCKMLGCEPYLSGNVGSGTVQELADWVQYVNFESKCPMSELRKKNGQQEPWGVKYWGIGNEAWGCGGNMKPEFYADKFREYTTFMKSNKTRLFKIASGAGGDDYHWTETLMKNIPVSMLDGIAMHHYAVIDWDHKGSAVNFSEREYFATMKEAWKMEEFVTKHSAVLDKYDPKKKVALVVDEWGGWYDVEPNTNPGFLYQQNTMRDAMIAGLTLNVFNNHADRVRLACLAQCVNVLQAVILTDKEKMILTPTYHVMEMYNVHQDAKLIPLIVAKRNYALGNDTLQAISASASVDVNGKTHISLVNIDPEKEQSISIDLSSEKYKSVTGRILTSAKLQDYNSFDEPNKIKPVVFKNASINGNTLTVQLPPISVVVLELK